MSFVNKTLLLGSVLAVSAAPLGACGPDSGLRAIPNEAPIAIALIDNGEADASEQRLGYVIRGDVSRLDGSASWDPDNSAANALVYSWSFDAMPEDSTLTDENIVADADDEETPEREDTFASFEPDVLGTYRVSLTVTDDDGEVSQPAIVVVQAVPPSNLTVELEWNQSGADMDLHLIAPGGTYFGTNDCFSWNPNPNWGNESLATDNPELLADLDGEGAGPFRELIGLEAPPEGTYAIWVHYFSDHNLELAGQAVAVDAEITIRVFDQVVGQTWFSPNPMEYGDIWKVGELSWPTREFTQANVESDHWAEGGPDYNE